MLAKRIPAVQRWYGSYVNEPWINWGWCSMSEVVEIANNLRCTTDTKWTAASLGEVFGRLNSAIVKDPNGYFWIWFTEMWDNHPYGMILKGVPWDRPTLFVPAKWAMFVLDLIEETQNGVKGIVFVGNRVHWTDITNQCFDITEKVMKAA